MTENGKMEKRMVTDQNLTNMTEVGTKENTSMINLKELALLHGVIKKNIPANGATEFSMVKEQKPVQTTLPTLENGEMACHMEKVSANMLIKVGMMDNGEMDNHMVRVQSLIKMGVSIRENGLMVKQQEKV